MKLLRPLLKVLFCDWMKKNIFTSISYYKHHVAVHFWIEPFLPLSLGTREVWVCNRIPRRYFLFVILLPS